MDNKHHLHAINAENLNHLFDLLPEYIWRVRNSPAHIRLLMATNKHAVVHGFGKGGVVFYNAGLNKVFTLRIAAAKLM